MTRYMLDTNMASYAIKGNVPGVRERLASLPMASVAVSAVTKGELLYGLAKKGSPARLAAVISEFLLRLDVLPWNERVAAVYGDLRASCEAKGVTLGALDMMIAAHALAAGMTLATRDKAFGRISRMVAIEDWTRKARF